MTLIRTFAVALSLASSALAKTDLAGCTYTDLVIKPTADVGYASRLYYVPDTGEVCQFLDCGGGRAPPKTTVPGCPQYSGTETYKPSYIDPKTLGNGLIERPTSVTATTRPDSTAAPSAASSTAAASATPTETATTDASIITLTGTNTGHSSQTGSSSAHVTGSSSSKPESSASKGGESSSSAKTTSPSAGAGAVPTAAAILGPCVMAAIAAGLA